MEEDRPIGAFGCVLAAALLFLVQGVADAVVGDSAGAVRAGLLSLVAGVIGIFSLLWTLVLGILAVLIYRAEEHHVALGVAVIVFSLLGFALGGGFLLGSLLGILGGYLAVRWEGSAPDPLSALNVSWSEGRSEFGQPGLPPRPAPVVVDPGRCANCHAALPARATVCAACETPVPRRAAPQVPPRVTAATPPTLP